MKKISCYSLVAIILLCTTMDIMAQKSTMLAKLDIIVPHMETIGNPDDFKELRRNDVSIRAQRNFMREYKNVSDAKWVISGNGLLAAYFTDAGIASRRYYNRKGIFEYMIRYYQEDKLNRSVRHLVKSKYYDFSISQVTEVTRNGNVAYLIDIEDKSSWKTIKLLDNEIEVVDELLKSE